MKFWTPTINTGLMGWQDYVIIIGAVALPGIVAFIWAAFFRSTGRRKSRRRRRRAMNPTLEETGGLPPIRKPEKPSDQPKF